MKLGSCAINMPSIVPSVHDGLSAHGAAGRAHLYPLAGVPLALARRELSALHQRKAPAIPRAGILSSLPLSHLSWRRHAADGNHVRKDIVTTGHAGARQITQGLNRGRRENTRPDESMGQELDDPPHIGFVRLMTRPLPHLWRVAYQHLERPGQYTIHRWPIDPRTLHSDHRTGLLDKPLGRCTWSQTRARPASPGRLAGHSGNRPSDTLDARQSRNSLDARLAWPLPPASPQADDRPGRWGSGCGSVVPTRARQHSTGRGASSRTNR
jgi:hypothetical protein